MQLTSANSDYINLVWIEIIKLNINVEFIELNQFKNL